MMPVDERSRHALYRKLEQALGAEEATTLMEHLPPAGWADVATKADLEQLRHATKADLEQLRHATKADLERLEQTNRSEHERLEQTNRSEHERLEDAFKAVEAKVDAGMEAMEHRLLGTFHRELVSQTRTFFLGNVGMLLAAGGLAVGAARLL